MPSKAGAATDTVFDRRSPSSRDGATEGKSAGRRRGDRTIAADVESSLKNGIDAGAPARKRRTTRDGRQPLVVYMRPESVKVLKMAAIESETTVSAIVAEAVGAWLRQRQKRPTRSAARRTP
jgi:hypothetical protein